MRRRDPDRAASERRSLRRAGSCRGRRPGAQVETAAPRRNRRSARGRLDPPLTAALDETELPPGRDAGRASRCSFDRRASSYREAGRRLHAVGSHCRYAADAALRKPCGDPRCPLRTSPMDAALATAILASWPPSRKAAFRSAARTARTRRRESRCANVCWLSASASDGCHASASLCSAFRTACSCRLPS